MASLYKRGDYWYASFYNATQKPRLKQVSLKTKIKREAEQRKVELEREYDRGRYDPWAPVQETVSLELLSEAVGEFIASRSNLSPYTVTKYRSVLGLFVTHQGAHTPIRSISTEDVQSFLNNPTTITTRTGKKRVLRKTPVTKKTYTSTLSPFFNWLAENGEIDSNPCERLRLAKVPQKFPRFMSTGDVDAICNAITEAQEHKKALDDSAYWLLPIIRANVYLGLRAGELVNLRWASVNFERRTITVANGETFTTKSGKERTLPLCDAVLKILQGLNRESEYVFPNYGGTKLHRQYLSRMFKHYASKAGLSNLNFHSTRHTCASWLAMKGASVEAIRLYMGHSSISVTQKYMHLAPDVFAEQITAAFASC